MSKSVVSQPTWKDKLVHEFLTQLDIQVLNLSCKRFQCHKVAFVHSSVSKCYRNGCVVTWYDHNFGTCGATDAVRGSFTGLHQVSPSGAAPTMAQSDGVTHKKSGHLITERSETCSGSIDKPTWPTWPLPCLIISWHNCRKAVDTLDVKKTDAKAPMFSVSILSSLAS